MSRFRSARRLILAFVLTAGAASARPPEPAAGTGNPARPLQELPPEPEELGQFESEENAAVPVGGVVRGGTVVFQATLWDLGTFDDFEDRTLEGDRTWTVGAGSWKVRAAGRGSWALTDVEAQGDSWIHAGGAGVQVHGVWEFVFRWRPPIREGVSRQADFWLMSDAAGLQGSGYFVRVRGGGPGHHVSLYRSESGNPVLLWEASAADPLGTSFHHLRVVRNPSGRFRILLDGAAVGTASDGAAAEARRLIVRHLAEKRGGPLQVDRISTSASASPRRLRLQVEVKPVGVPFDGETGLFTGDETASGSVGRARAAGLSAGRYRWRARAVDETGRASLWRSFGENPETEGDFEIPAGAAPGNFRGTALSTGSILWEWDDVAGESRYEIHDETHGRLAGVGADVTSWRETEGLSENALYVRHVHAVFGSAAGEPSGSAGRYTRVHDPTADDLALTVVSSNRIDVAVAPPPNSAAGLTACRIERSSDGANWTAPPLKSFDEPGYSKSDTGLAPETTYYYRIAYRNGDGVVTAISPVRSATTLPLPPPAPTGLSAEPGDRQVTLRWNAVAQATGYRVKRSLVSGGPYDTVADGVTATSWTDANLVNGVRYHYVVTATNPGGESPPSGEASATPGVPPPPTNLAARVERGIVTLTWDASPGATSYNVYRGTSPGGPYPTPVASGVTGTSATDAPDVSGMTCYYIVTGRNLYGEGLPSNEASAFIPPRPLPPANVRTISYANAVDVEWDPSPTPDVAGYNVYRKLESDPVWRTVPLNGDRLILNTRYRDGTVVAGLRYVYRVTAVGR